VAILVNLESLQNGYELHEKVLIRMGWDMATAQAEEKFNSLQQRHAKIAAELEQCAVDMNSDKLIPIVTCLNQWARLLRQ